MKKFRIRITVTVFILLILSSIQISAKINDLNVRIEKLEKQISWALILKKIGLSEDDAAYLFTISVNSVKKIEELKSEKIDILEKMKQAIYNDDHEEIQRLNKELYNVELKILEEQIKTLNEFDNVIDKIKMEKLQALLQEEGWSTYLKRVPFEDAMKELDKLLGSIPEDIKEKATEVFRKVERLYNSVSAQILFGLVINEDFIEALRIVGKLSPENPNQ